MESNATKPEWGPKRVSGTHSTKWLGVGHADIGDPGLIPTSTPAPTPTAHQLLLHALLPCQKGLLSGCGLAAWKQILFYMPTNVPIGVSG